MKKQPVPFINETTRLLREFKHNSTYFLPLLQCPRDQQSLVVSGFNSRQAKLQVSCTWVTSVTGSTQPHEDNGVAQVRSSGTN